MLPKSSRLLLLIVLFAACTTWAKADTWKNVVPPAADTSHAKNPLLKSDSTQTKPASNDTLAADTSTVRQRIPDSTSLLPNLYTPGTDTLFLRAYRSDTATTANLHSPTITLFKSVAFPGWGQYTNRKYLKAALVFAVESYFIYGVIDYAGKTSDWRRKWLNAPLEPSNVKSEYFRQYTDYRDSRNGKEWGVAVVIFISMFDAYVDAHLASFPHRGNINPAVEIPHPVSLVPEIGDGFALRLKYSF